MMVKSKVTLIIASGRGTGGLSISLLQAAGILTSIESSMFRGYNL